jgi:hypothetical protein
MFIASTLTSLLPRAKQNNPKHDNLRQVLLHQLVRSSIIMGATIGVMLVLLVLRYYTDANVVREKDALQQLQSGISQAITQGQAFDNAYLLWCQLPENAKTLEGVRLTEGQNLFVQLRDRFHLRNATMTVSKPIETNPSSKGKISVWTSNVRLSFWAYTDVYALSFLQEFIARFPGYIRFISVDMERKEDPNRRNDNTTSAISAAGELGHDSHNPADAQARLEAPVETIIVFDWNDMRTIDTSITHKTSDQNTGGSPPIPRPPAANPSSVSGKP